MAAGALEGEVMQTRPSVKESEGISTGDSAGVALHPGSDRGSQARHQPAEGAGPRPPRPRTRDLAEVFGREPELIAACLQGSDQAPMTWSRQILAAARRAVARYPNYADLHYHAGQAAVVAGEVDLARAWLDRAIRIHPDYKDALVLAARVEHARHRVQEAERLLQRALAAGADYPDVYLLFGQVCAEQGRWSEARQAYHRALELNSHLSAAREALATLPAGDEGPRAS